MRSASFLSTCAGLYQAMFCAGRWGFSHHLLTKDSKYIYWLIGLFAGGTGVMIEKKPRRTELALLVRFGRKMCMFQTALAAAQGADLIVSCPTRQALDVSAPAGRLFLVCLVHGNTNVVLPEGTRIGQSHGGEDSEAVFIRGSAGEPRRSCAHSLLQ